ncbi:MAG: hypothetical protein MMC23_009482 [Stictis urceolatum]|nr:hypothetical protein [Stictis urceolata]
MLDITSQHEEKEGDDQNTSDEQEFEDDDEEFDPAHPYRSIVQQLTLDIGTGVLDLALPRLPQKDPSSFTIVPELLEENMLIALACSDSTVRLLTLPLTPPDPVRGGGKLMKNDFSTSFIKRADWIDSMITIPMSQGHRNPPRGVSLALVHRPVSVEGDEGASVVSGHSASNHAWEVLIASHSADVSGRMLIHKIPISADERDIEQPPSDEILWRSEKLSEPAASVQIHATLSTNELEVPRVLVAGSSGSARIYECSKESNPYEGFWGVTLQASHTSANGTLDMRKILDAQWVLGGHGVCVLTADGEWGIWDVTPSYLSKTMSGNHSTRFTLSGWISSGLQSQPSSTAKSGARSSLAPMTPNTRKIRQDALFTRPPTPSDTATAACGGISLSFITPSHNGNDDDESLLLWYTGHAVLIPSLRAHWRANSKTVLDPLGGGSGSQARDLPLVELPGEEHTGVAVFPEEESSARSALRAKPNDFLVVGERSFVVVAAPLQKPLGSIVEHDSSGFRSKADRALLARGELSVDGLDRMLDDMAGEAPKESSSTAGLGAKKRKVGFTT